MIYRYKEDTDIPETEQCTICMRRAKKDKALVPCGHTQYCNKCITGLKEKECPLCRAKVDMVIKIYK